MIRPIVALIASALAFARIADAGEAAADRAFREASELAVAGDPRAIEAFEALGATRPPTRWTDDAWVEAARLAERARDYRRARRDLEQLIALGDAADARLVDNARVTLRRLANITAAGAWDDIAREHERLIDELNDGGDPREALRALERLVTEHPVYPRATIARLAIAQVWEREGDGSRGITWYRAALAKAGLAERQRVGLALARASIRRDELDEARRVLDMLASESNPDRAAIAEVHEKLDVARGRASIRTLLWIVLGTIVLVAAALLRRDAGSWRLAARLLLHPPAEVLFLAPISGVLIVIAQTGNPVVADAVTGIVIAGIVIAWLSGALLEANRRRRQRLAASRSLLQAAVTVVAVGAAAYLAVEQFRVIDLLAETWEHGPAAR